MKPDNITGRSKDGLNEVVKRLNPKGGAEGLNVLPIPSVMVSGGGAFGK